MCVRHGISFCTYADEHPCAARAELIKHPKGAVGDPPNKDVIGALYATGMWETKRVSCDDACGA